MVAVSDQEVVSLRLKGGLILKKRIASSLKALEQTKRASKSRSPTHLEVSDEALLYRLQVQRQLLEQDLVEAIELEIRVDKDETVDRYVVRLKTANAFVVGKDWRVLVIFLVPNGDRSQKLNRNVFLSSK